MKIDLKETEWVGIDWFHLSENRDKWWAVVKIVMNEPLGSVKFRELLD
jgi:hypothetical protein